MFRFVAILATLVSAAAFAPVSRVARSALKMTYENAVGVTSPAGFFDPLGLSKDISQETFDQYRASEIKHGRVAMLGVLGYIATETYKFPGEIAPGVTFASIPSGIAAIEVAPISLTPSSHLSIHRLTLHSSIPPSLTESLLRPSPLWAGFKCSS
jgi:hypothetical protein